MYAFFDSIEGAARATSLRVLAAVRLERDASAVFRIVYALLALAFAMPTFSWLAGTPQAFYRPPLLSVAALFDDWPAGWWLRGLDLLLPAAAGLLAVGWRSRACSVVLGLGMLLGWSFENSFGKVDHYALFPLTALCFAISGWGTRLAVRPERAGAFARFAPALLAVALATGMTSAGVAKVIGWVDFDLTTSGTLSWLYSGLYRFGRSPALAEAILALPPLVQEGMDYAAALLEATAFIWLLAGRRSWMTYVTLLCSFHLATSLVLGIHFHYHLAVYAPFLLAGLPHAAAHPSPRGGWAVLGGLAFGLAAAHVVARLGGRGGSFLVVFDPALPGSPALPLTAICWALMSCVGVVAVLRDDSHGVSGGTARQRSR